MFHQKPPPGTPLNKSHRLAPDALCLPMNEGTGDKIYDYTGNGNHGTLTNMSPATDWVPGKDGVALDFDGSNDHIEIANAPSLNPTSQITISVWVKFAAFNSYGMFISKNYASQYAVMNYDTTGRIRFDLWPWFSYSGSHGMFLTDSGDAVSLDTWYLIVCTFDGANARVYIDGVLKKTSTAVSGSIATTANDLWLGQNVSNSNPFSGQISCVGISDRALSAVEVQQLYSQPWSMFGHELPMFGVGAAGISIPLVMQQMNQFDGGSMAI